MRACTLLLLLTAMAACRPEPVTPDPIPPFTGTSPTDFNGAALGDPDTSDWRLDDAWFPAEAALFPAGPTATCPSPSGAAVFPAYPNPCGDVLSLAFISPSNALWDMVLVDGDLEPLRRIESFAASPGTNNLQFDLSPFPADTLRLYYRMRLDGCVLRGHGDVVRN